MNYHIEPSAEEKESGMVTKNAIRCRICGSMAHRYESLFQCSANENHCADLNTGVFSDFNVENIVQEDATSTNYRGVGKLHYIKSPTGDNKNVYLTVVESVGRGYVGLILTEEERENAEHRYLTSRSKSIEPKTFWQIVLSGELWRLFKR